jgi:uncharacterized protein YndB with AHSA1/START domain
VTTGTTTVRPQSEQSRPAATPSSFEYTIYIACTPEKLWHALTLNELRAQWWRGHTVETDWKVGSAITGRFADGSLEFKGHVLEADSPRQLGFEIDEVSWTDEYAGQGPNRLYFAIEGFEQLVKLTLRNEAPPRMLQLVGQGWPAVLSSLKSLLETGTPLPLDAVFGPERNPGKSSEPTGLG